MILFNLFWAFFQIGLFSFGGGYAALPLIREQVVLNNAWMTAAEFTDLITISQMTPGPIAINAASFIGARLAGIPGAVVATIGNILPSCAIALLLAFLYRKYHNLALIGRHRTCNKHILIFSKEFLYFFLLVIGRLNGKVHFLFSFPYQIFS